MQQLLVVLIFKFNSDDSVSIKPVDETFGILKWSWIIDYFRHQNRDQNLSYQGKRSKINKENLILLREQVENLYDNIYYNKLSVKKFGEILDTGWEIKKNYLKKFNQLINNIYDLAKNWFIWGKLSGAGGGEQLLKKCKR